MKLPLAAKPKSLSFFDWTESEPFVENTRAVLIHRPRFVSEHKISDKYPFHLSVMCWCGNSFSGRKQFTFLDRVPSGRLLCQRCEVAAFSKGQPTAESLTGGHVHLGKVVAVQTCCAMEASK